MPQITAIDIRDLQKQQALEPEVETYKTGFDKLDQITGGLEPDRLVVVSGKTGEGKTTFLQTLTRNFVNQGMGAIWLSYEVGMREFVNRFGKVLPPFYVPTPELPDTLQGVEDFIIQAKKDYGIQVVFIDHLHYLLNMGDLAKVNSISLNIGDVVRRLKRISIKTNTLIFLIAHPGKTQVENVPTSSDIRDSSFITQEADYVFMVWRKKGEMQEVKGVISYEDTGYLKVDKNRKTGKLDYVNLFYQDGYFYERTTQKTIEGKKQLSLSSKDFTG